MGWPRREPGPRTIKDVTREMVLAMKKANAGKPA